MGNLARVALSIGAAALLAACGGSQPPIGAPAVMPQSVEAQSKAHKASASSGDLLYVLAVSPPTRKVRLRAFTFPGLKQVSNLPVKATRELCSDAQGNIFIPQDDAVDEYAHGGNRPIQTLSDPDFRSVSCAVDNTTGNLAVTNADGRFAVEGDVVVYKGAKGSPIPYEDPIILYYDSCGYDGSGNLFIVGLTTQLQAVLVELPKGAEKFTYIRVDKGVYPGSVQWDGEYLVVQGPANTLYRVQVFGSTGTVVGVITLDHVPPRGTNYFGISGNEVAATYPSKLGLWPYPDGGEPNELLSIRGHRLYGVTVSVAPSRSSIRK